MQPTALPKTTPPPPTQPSKPPSRPPVQPTRPSKPINPTKAVAAAARAIDDPVMLARAARIVRVALARRDQQPTNDRAA